MTYLYAVLGWVVWCTLHSALISIPVTEYMERKLGDGFRFYRLFYNIFSLATLIPLLFYTASMRQEPVFRWEGPLGIIPYILLATGIGLFIIGGRNYSLFQLLGIAQIKRGGTNRSLSEYGKFVVSGIHRMIRHPWYLGGMMIVWARDLSLSTILTNLVISSYLVIGAILEERKLVGEIGEPYREYQRNVSMLFPYKWLKAKCTGKPQDQGSFNKETTNHRPLSNAILPDVTSGLVPVCRRERR
ncbi:MAG: NnrU family protein [Deltaproteobacteria bacterium]|nr:NnrU family protein [Deltaproteobacteria bacterium]